MSSDHGIDDGASPAGARLSTPALPHQIVANAACANAQRSTVCGRALAGVTSEQMVAAIKTLGYRATVVP